MNDEDSRRRPPVDDRDFPDRSRGGHRLLAELVLEPGQDCQQQRGQRALQGGQGARLPQGNVRDQVELW